MVYKRGYCTEPILILFSFKIFIYVFFKRPPRINKIISSKYKIKIDILMIKS